MGGKFIFELANPAEFKAKPYLDAIHQSKKLKHPPELYVSYGPEDMGQALVVKVRWPLPGGWCAPCVGGSGWWKLRIFGERSATRPRSTLFACVRLPCWTVPPAAVCLDRINSPVFTCQRGTRPARRGSAPVLCNPRRPRPTHAAGPLE